MDGHGHLFFVLFCFLPCFCCDSAFWGLGSVSNTWDVLLCQGVR